MFEVINAYDEYETTVFPTFLRFVDIFAIKEFTNN